MKDHICREPSPTCCCRIDGDEPKEDCPIHGAGPWPPQCGECGRFIPWEEARRARGFPLTLIREDR
jgi:hypothetical protein